MHIQKTVKKKVHIYAYPRIVANDFKLSVVPYRFIKP